MVQKGQLKKITDYQWEIPLTTRSDMKVPAYVYAKEEMLDAMLSDRSMEQLINVATMPGIVKAAMVMPDAHEGYGFPIGGVAATAWPDGIISPGGIGYDINCGVRLLLTPQHCEDVQPKLPDLIRELFAEIPSGAGRGGDINLSEKEVDDVLKLGAQWAVKNGFGNEKDLELIESGGRLENADPNVVSSQAKKRGHDQLGTIGSGNHFVEVDKVSEIFDNKIADAFGLKKNQVVVLIHTGSRGLGHQVATDYLKIMMNVMTAYNFNPIDRELAGVPLNSPEGRDYFNAMAAAANFAWCNREVISYKVRKAWKKIFMIEDNEIELLYDVAHNIAKIEEHRVDGKMKKLIVHRKGATRAFGPMQKDIPEKFRKIGQPVLIPGSMGTGSYVLIGSNKSMEATFGSTCHGAGRRLSRHAAKKQIGGRTLRDQLFNEQGIIIRSGSMKGIAEEAPFAYKDIDVVVDTVHEAGIALKVAKLKPMAVIKG
jgi:tRNA-splicing ligase RtcB